MLELKTVTRDSTGNFLLEFCDSDGDNVLVVMLDRTQAVKLGKELPKD